MISRNLQIHSRRILAAVIFAVLLVSNAPQSPAQQPTLVEVPQQNKALSDLPLPQPEATTDPGEVAPKIPTATRNSRNVFFGSSRTTGP
jgi:hypothetical protein